MPALPGDTAMRSIWKGHIRFLLVAIPVRIYNALETSEKIQFNQLHREDYGPIGYDKRCKKCSQVVSNDQITKGYQYEPDRYAIVEPEDIAKVKIKTTRAVDIVGFVDSSEIPTTFYDAPYYAGPDGPVSEKPYALLREVMKQTGKVGIGKIVLRDRSEEHTSELQSRQYLVCRLLLEKKTEQTRTLRQSELDVIVRQIPDRQKSGIYERRPIMYEAIVLLVLPVTA